MSKTSDRHELIAARAAIATPGPWVYGDDRDGRGDRLYRRENKYDPIADFEYTKDHDAEFIAHAREDIPWLLAALARSERKLTDQVARNDNLVNIATALNQDAFELQGDLDRAEQKLTEQAATIEAVKVAYLHPGSHPEYHYQEKASLHRSWPMLVKALEALSNGGTP